MGFTSLYICMAVFVVSNGFIFNLFGPKDQCQMDSDCDQGCCLNKLSSTGHAYKACVHYILPAGACSMTSDGMPDSKTSCGCTPGYKCVSPDTDGLALEPTTHVKGFCDAVNGTSGPQIAVEGGR